MESLAAKQTKEVHVQQRRWPREEHCFSTFIQKRFPYTRVCTLSCIIVRSKKTLARECRIRDSMFLFLAVFFSFSSMSACSKKNILFCLINLTALRYLLAYLPYVMFKITVVKDFASPRLLVLPLFPPTEELFDVEMCTFKNSYIER